jgi:hypothetical protein
LDRRVASLRLVAALAVAGRSAWGRITTPLPSHDSTSTSPAWHNGGDRVA